jgi:hypothetical protein
MSFYAQFNLEMAVGGAGVRVAINMANVENAK